MKILSTLILILITFFKKFKIHELLRENVKKTKKLLFFTDKLKFFARLSPGGGGWPGSHLNCTTEYMGT